MSKGDSGRQVDVAVLEPSFSRSDERRLLIFTTEDNRLIPALWSLMRLLRTRKSRPNFLQGSRSPKWLGVFVNAVTSTDFDRGLLDPAELYISGSTSVL